MHSTAISTENFTLTVIIHVYNERNTIKAAIKAVMATPYSKEIIISGRLFHGRHQGYLERTEPSRNQGILPWQEHGQERRETQDRFCKGNRWHNKIKLFISHTRHQGGGRSPYGLPAPPPWWRGLRLASLSSCSHFYNDLPGSLIGWKNCAHMKNDNLWVGPFSLNKWVHF